MSTIDAFLLWHGFPYILAFITFLGILCAVYLYVTITRMDREMAKLRRTISDLEYKPKKY